MVNGFRNVSRLVRYTRDGLFFTGLKRRLPVFNVEGPPAVSFHQRTIIHNTGMAATCVRLMSSLRTSELRRALEGGRKKGPVWHRESEGYVVNEARNIKIRQQALVKTIRRLGEDGEWKQATRCFDGARKTGLPMNAHIYTATMSALTNGGAWRGCRSLLQLMRMDEVKPTSLSYLTVIDACARKGEWKAALQELQSMKQVDGLLVDVKCMAACMNASAKAGQYAHALELLRGIPFKFRTAEMYGAAMDACVRGGEYKSALEVFNQMGSSGGGAGAKRDEVHYSIAFAACAKGNMPPEKALALLLKMKKEGLVPDVICYTQVMHALSQGRRWKQVIQLLRHSMPASGVQPTVVSYNVAINACSQCGQFKWAKNLLEEMKDAGLTPDGWSYYATIRGAPFLEAMAVVKDMELEMARPGGRHLIQPRSAQLIYYLVAASCMAAGKIEEANKFQLKAVAMQQ